MNQKSKKIEKLELENPDFWSNLTDKNRIYIALDKINEIIDWIEKHEEAILKLAEIIDCLEIPYLPADTNRKKNFTSRTKLIKSILEFK